MPQELQIKATILDIESKVDKNNNPYWRLSLVGLPACYYYVFNYNLAEKTLSLLKVPHNLVNRQVLITYQELPNKDHTSTFCKVKEIQIL